MLTTAELQLLAQALDPQAGPAEIEMAARKLISSMRERGAHASDFLAADQRMRTIPDWGAYRCPFKKYKGIAIREIPLEYLTFIMGWVAEQPEVYAKFSGFFRAVEQYLTSTDKP